MVGVVHCTKKIEKKIKKRKIGNPATDDSVQSIAGSSMGLQQCMSNKKSFANVWDSLSNQAMANYGALDPYSSQYASAYGL